MKPATTTETTDEQDHVVKRVMILYGAALFSGLLLSIFTHPVEDIGGFLLFLAVSAVVYFLVLTLYFKKGVWKNIAFAIVALIALISIVMIFYLEISSVSN